MNQKIIYGLVGAAGIGAIASLFFATRPPASTQAQLAAHQPASSGAAQPQSAVDAFLQAIAEQDQEAVEAYLKDGFDPNGGLCLETARTSDEDQGITADCQNFVPLLHLLTTFPNRVDPEMLDQLLESGVNVNVKNRAGETPLQALGDELDAPDGWVATVSAILIANGADVNARDRQNRTVLETALCAETPNNDLVAQLVEGGANVADLNAQSLCGTTLLHLAARANHPDLVAFALAAAIDINAKDGDGNTPLHYLRGPEAGEILLANGADLEAQNALGKTPLAAAICLHGGYDLKPDVIAFLVDQGAESQDLPLEIDCGRGSATLLSEAIGSDSAALAAIAIANGSDITARDGAGQTPLHQTGRFNAAKVAATLLAEQADINAVDDDGYTPLHMAAIHRNLEIAKFLITQGADVNARDEAGHTPLYEAENGFWEPSAGMNPDATPALVDLLIASGGTK